MHQLIPFIIHHWPLWVAFVVVLLAIFANEYLLQKKRPALLSTAAAVHQINHQSAHVIDIRPVEDFKQGHIVDAIQALPEAFKQSRMDKYKNKPVILVCTRGLTAATLATQLRTQGFTQVMVLDGGMTAWRAAGLPLIKGKK